MNGDLIYPDDAPDGHCCYPPLPSSAPRGTVWVCTCGKAKVKTRYTCIPETWRRMYCWDFRARRVRKAALAKRRVHLAEDQFRKAQEIVDSYEAVDRA